MIYQGSITSVSSARVIDTQYGPVTFNSMVVENRTINDKRLGMCFQLRSPLAEKADKLFQEYIQGGKYPVVEVQFESVIREFEKDGERKTICDNNVINIVKIA